MILFTRIDDKIRGIKDPSPQLEKAMRKARNVNGWTTKKLFESVLAEFGDVSEITVRSYLNKYNFIEE